MLCPCNALGLLRSDKYDIIAAQPVVVVFFNINERKGLFWLTTCAGHAGTRSAGK
jgi:hypothetical protein